MNDKGESKNSQKDENLSFSFQDILSGNQDNQSFQPTTQSFRDENNQSTPYNTLPPELQHLFSMPNANASSNVEMWNSIHANSSNNAVASPHNSSEGTTPNAGPLQSLGATSASPIPPETNSSSPVQFNVAKSITAINNDSSSITSPAHIQQSMSASPQLVNQATKPSPSSSHNSSPHIRSAQSTPQQLSPQTNSQTLPISPQINTTQQSSPLLDNGSPHSSPLTRTSSQLSMPQQASPQPIRYASSPQVQTIQAQPALSDIVRAPTILASQSSPKAIAPQGSNNNKLIQPQPQVQQAPAPAAVAGGASSAMTLLDNLIAELSPDRKDKFKELFRQLQNNEISANQFLEEAKKLLGQQQYQQLENLKSKPNISTQPMASGIVPGRNVIPTRPPIQPYQQQPQQPAMAAAGPTSTKMKRTLSTLSSSQLRAEDAQRSMSGLISPQPKRTRNSDIPNNSNSSNGALPLYRSNNATGTTTNEAQLVLQQKQQQLLHQQQQYLFQQQMIQQQQSHINEEQQSSSQQGFMNTEMLNNKLSKLISDKSLKLQPDVATVIALATQTRITRLIHHMISASKHRIDSQTFTQPTIDETGHLPFKIVDVQDIKKQLLAIERVEREEERKRKEMILERERKAQLGEEGNDEVDDTNNTAGGSGSKPKKKKKKEMGPSVAARYMSEDARNKSTNETVRMAAGGAIKSWMLVGAGGAGGAGASGGGGKDKPSVPRQGSATYEPLPTTPTTPSMIPVISPTQIEVLTPPPTSAEDANQPRGRGRPRRRKSGSGTDLISGAMGSAGKKRFLNRSNTQDGGLFLPPSTIGRPHRLGEQGSRKITIRDALFVLEDEYENSKESARRTLVKAYANLLK